MIEDKYRWNERHVKKPMSNRVTPLLKNYLDTVSGKNVIDIACGTGRNTHYLANLGFKIDAVDYSDYALSQVNTSPNINKIEVDLDTYHLEENSYDLILNCNYLNRRLIKQMANALKVDGVIMFETFIVAHENPEEGSMNPDYLLQPNELLKSFRNIHIIYYEERKDKNTKGENVTIASLVAKKL